MQPNGTGKAAVAAPRIRKINSTNSRFLAEAAQRKALMATFFANGDPFSSGIKVSINPGRDFRTIENLYDYLSQRLNVSNGVRVIFTVDGKRVSSLDLLEDGGSYVASGSRTFAPLAYGQSRSRGTLPPQRSDEDPSRLINLVGNKKPPGILSKGQGSSGSLPGSGNREDGRVINVVSLVDTNHRSRVLLNLKTTQTFEEVLQDLGGALNMKNVKRMTTANGEVVRSLLFQFHFVLAYIKLAIAGTGGIQCLNCLRIRKRTPKGTILSGNFPSVQVLYRPLN